MNATPLKYFLGTATPFLVALGLTFPAVAGPFTIVDGEGFEAPEYSTSFLTTGQLEGQFASTSGGLGSAQWVQSPVSGTGTAVVQTAVVASGAQAVQVDRAANSDDRWAVPVTGFPAPSERFVCIEWDMYVEQTVTPTGFGPLFGIEAYDDATASRLRIGTLGVDAATGDVLVTSKAAGLIETGTLVNFDEWNSFRMILDFQTDIYYAYLNGVQIFSTGFEEVDFNGLFGEADEFTDADITAIAASGDPISQALTGTAYFDNYFVFETDDINKIPEPASVALLAMLLGVSLATVRRK